MWWFALVPGAHAQAFGLDAPFALVGDAKFTGSVLWVAPRNEEVGAAWVDQAVPIPDGGGFVATFTAQLEAPRWEADEDTGGLALVVQGDGPGALGDLMGYEEVAPSIAVELDPDWSPLWEDPDGNHLGIDVDGSLQSVAAAEVPFLLEDAVVHVRVEAFAGELRAWIDDEGEPDGAMPPLVSAAVDLPAGDVWVGFTASNGDEFAGRQVLAFAFQVVDAYGEPVTPEPTGGDDGPGVDTGGDPGTGPGADPGPDPGPGGAEDVPDEDDWSDIPRVFFCGCAAEPAVPRVVAWLAPVAAVVLRRRRGAVRR